MPAYRFPILLIRDPAGLHTAVLVEDNGSVAAVAETRTQAVGQIRDHLEKQYKRQEWLAAPDFEDPELAMHRVEVRPEYVEAKRPYPCGETVALRVPVVTGKTEAGLRVAAVPTFGIRFVYYDAADLKPLVVQYVQAALRGQTPADVARFLAPAGVELDDVVIQVPRTRPPRARAAETEELSAVADPLAAREVRSRYSRAWERDELVNRLVAGLVGERAPILLVGESGVGKTSILADAARRIERENLELGGPAHTAADDDDLPKRRAHRFWLTSAPRIVSGMQYLGMWQERVEAVIAELGQISGVLCVENLLDLVRTGGSSPVGSIAAFCGPFLARGELRLVAEATPAELDAVRRLLPGLADLFRIIVVPPFDRAGAAAALGAVASTLRQNLHVEYERGAVDTVLRLFARFMPYSPFPGQAAAFVNELFERARGPAATAKRTVTANAAIDLFVRRTGLPESLLRDEIALPPAEIFDRLRREVIGQDEPCRAAAAVVTTLKAGLNDPTRPLGVLLFTGPTGVGKTQLAQSLAKLMFGARTVGSRQSAVGSDNPDPTAHRPLPTAHSALIRLDMSEYAGPDAADRFLGTAHGGPPEWLQRVRHQPFCVLLLDEIEKAAPEIFDVLLGVFDEGRLTDPWGRLTWFRSSVIVMTSNLGAGRPEPFGLSRGAGPAYDDAAMTFFRPEFYNRIDAVVTFDPLTPETIRRITAKELAEIAAREGLEKRALKLTWTHRLIASLAEVGFDPRYGARPLQRTIEQRVVTVLARWLVDNPDVTRATLRLDLSETGAVTVAVEP